MTDTDFMQPYADFESLARDFRRHVAPGKLAYFENAGMPFVLGRREGIWFEDAYSGKRFINCHCNGGVFHIGKDSALPIICKG